MKFELYKTAKNSKARLGKITTPRGEITTPIFMPVGTIATVKAMTPDELLQIGAEIILGNTYHLFLRPGHKTIEKLGGLHQFMNWKKPILTDSGGYQIFSLSQSCKISEEGALFQSPIDGGVSHLLTPELAIEIQESLGSDIMMVLDECLPYPSTPLVAQESMELSLRWAERSLNARHTNAALFGIVQGGMYKELRREYIDRLLNIRHNKETQDFEGFSIGGLSVGEPIPKMVELTDFCTDFLPQNKPRYLMGVGKPHDLIECIDRGVDMFDCILPTRAARHGTIYTSRGVITITHAEYKEDPRPLDENCNCHTCRSGYSRAYIRHLTMAHEILSARLSTLHNLHYYLSLIGEARLAIEEDRYPEFKKTFSHQQSAVS